MSIYMVPHVLVRDAIRGTVFCVSRQKRLSGWRMCHIQLSHFGSCHYIANWRSVMRHQACRIGIGLAPGCTSSFCVSVSRAEIGNAKANHNGMLTMCLLPIQNHFTTHLEGGTRSRAPNGVKKALQTLPRVCNTLGSAGKLSRIRLSGNMYTNKVYSAQLQELGVLCVPTKRQTCGLAALNIVATNL